MDWINKYQKGAKVGKELQDFGSRMLHGQEQEQNYLAQR